MSLTAVRYPVLTDADLPRPRQARLRPAVVIEWVRARSPIITADDEIYPDFIRERYIFERLEDCVTLFTKKNRLPTKKFGATTDGGAVQVTRCVLSLLRQTTWTLYSRGHRLFRPLIVTNLFNVPEGCKAILALQFYWNRTINVDVGEPNSKCQTAHERTCLRLVWDIAWSQSIKSKRLSNCIITDLLRTCLRLNVCFNDAFYLLHYKLNSFSRLQSRGYEWIAVAFLFPPLPSRLSCLPPRPR